MNDFVVTIDSDKYLVELIRTDKVKVDGREKGIEISKLSEFTYQIQIENKVFHVTANKLSNNHYSFLLDGHYFESLVRTKLEEKAAEILERSGENKGETIVFSPMPGMILRCDKNVGEPVIKGEAIILLEAMKMENEIRSPSDGIISEYFIQEGHSVEKNQKLLLIK